jgi:hypothetical protein
MKKTLVLPILLLILLISQQEASAQQEPAGASAYLVGVFDNRGDDLTTILHIVNPTNANLRLFVAFFDDRETFLPLREDQRCISETLSHNRLLEINVRDQGLPASFGVVKIVTFALNDLRPQIGVVGNQRLNLRGQPATETGLHPIQLRILDESELQVIIQACNIR